MVILKKVAFTYGKEDVWIINHLNGRLSSPGLLLIKGKSGRGKSTLLKLIVGALKPSLGKIKVKGVNHFAYHHCSWFDQWTVADYLSWLRIPRRALAMLNLTNLPNQQVVKTLSGGEQMRLLIVLLTYHPAPVMVFDEPLSALGSQHHQQVIDALFTVSQQALVIIATHHEQWNRVKHDSFHFDRDEKLICGSSYHRQKNKKVAKPFLPRLQWKTFIKPNLINKNWVKVNQALLLITLMSGMMLIEVWSAYKRHMLNFIPDTFAYEIRLKQRFEIPQSPFALVAYSLPEIEAIQALFAYDKSIHIVPDIRQIIDPILTIDGTVYQIFFYWGQAHDDGIDMKVYGPAFDTDYMIDQWYEDSSNGMTSTWHLQKPVHVLTQKQAYLPSEQPYIILSYPQWYAWLTYQWRSDSGEGFLQTILEHVQLDRWLIFPSQPFTDEVIGQINQLGYEMIHPLKMAIMTSISLIETILLAVYFIGLIALLLFLLFIHAEVHAEMIKLEKVFKHLYQFGFKHEQLFNSWHMFHFKMAYGGAIILIAIAFFILRWFQSFLPVFFTSFMNLSLFFFILFFLTMACIQGFGKHYVRRAIAV